MIARAIAGAVVLLLLAAPAQASIPGQTDIRIRARDAGTFKVRTIDTDGPGVVAYTYRIVCESQEVKAAGTVSIGRVARMPSPQEGRCVMHWRGHSETPYLAMVTS